MTSLLSLWLSVSFIVFDLLVNSTHKQLYFPWQIQPNAVVEEDAFRQTKLQLEAVAYSYVHAQVHIFAGKQRH